jgi:hypothetical protein
VVLEVVGIGIDIGIGIGIGIDAVKLTLDGHLQDFFKSPT